MSSDRKEHSFRFSGWTYTFMTDHGVFSKTKVDAGTEIFLKTLENEDITGSVLDLGCGYGVIGIVLKKIKPFLAVTSVDVNPRAVELTELNADVNHVQIQACVSDGFKMINNTFDSVVMNPPIRAGKKVIYELFAGAYEHLNDNGSLYIVIRRQQGAESAFDYLNNLFDNCDVINRKKGYWILRSKKLTD